MPSYVVTGASRGLGLEFVRQLSANKENTVFGLVRNLAGSPALLELQKSRSNLHVLKADILDLPALEAAAADIAKITGGSLDYLINNAAYVDDETREISLDAFPDEKTLAEGMQKSFNVNVIGVLHTTNTFLPLLKKGSVKKVVSLSTGLADLEFTRASGSAVHVPYSVSKAALNMVVVKYGARFKDEGFTFLAISPGLVNTSLRPPTPEELVGIKQMVTQFMSAAPGWNGQPITPEVSVKHMLDTIRKTTVADTGAFISHFGNKQWL
ncbi:short-chain dehydrogenases/reductase [Sparassis latifolia]